MRFNTNDHLGRRIKKANKKIDWLSRIVQFVCGVIVGGVIAVLNTDTYNKDEYIFSIICYALISGILAAIFGNKFWQIFKYRGSGRM